jgi:hypothetical protein
MPLVESVAGFTMLFVEAASGQLRLTLRRRRGTLLAYERPRS